MSNLAQTVLRLHIDASRRDAFLDDATGATPAIWRGTDVQFDFAIFYDRALRSVSNFQTVMLEVKAKEDRLGAALMAKTISSGALTASVTPDQWEAGTHQHGSFVFSAAETALDLKGQNERQFWLVISAVTNLNKRLTLGATELTIHEDGTPGAFTTPQLGSNLVPQGAAYNGLGRYTLGGLTANKAYKWTPGTNDTSVTNGNQTVTVESNITAQSNALTLNGTPNALVTAVVRGSVYATMEENDARYQLKWEVTNLIADIDAAQATADAAIAAAQVAQAGVIALQLAQHAPVTLGEIAPNIVLPMTDVNVPASQTASASSEINPAWKAFNGVANSVNDGWIGAMPPAPDPGCACEPGHEPHVWLQLQFATPKIVTKYILFGSATPARSPQKWYVEGSNDGTNWTILQTVIEQTGWAVREKREYEVAHTHTGYTRYRWKIVANNGDATFVEIEEIQIEDTCRTLIAEMVGQVLYLRGTRLAEGGHIICGPGGLMIDFEPFELANNEGLVIYSPIPPDVSAFPRYARYLWVDISDDQLEVKKWNPFETAQNKWVSIWRKGNEGGIYRGPTSPDLNRWPKYKNYLWINDAENPPSLNVWNENILDWQNICHICSIGSGSPGKLPNVVFSPESGAAVPVTVALSVPGHTSGITIYYTTDGSPPTTGSSVYSAPLNLAANTTVKAFAVRTGWADSDVSEASYGALVIDSWLLNVNYRGSGQPNKTGGAATFNNTFSDWWNNLLAPTESSPAYVLRKADQSLADGVAITYSLWGESSTFQFFNTGSADAMFNSTMKNVDGGYRDVGIYLTLPPTGVYDVYLYGHGPADWQNTAGYVEDDLGTRATKKTSHEAGWNTTVWQEDKQYVLFEAVEPSQETHMGSEYQVFAGTALLVVKHYPVPHPVSTLVMGQRYVIIQINPADDFTNVGASANVAGQQFIATGTTPAAWAHHGTAGTPGATVIYALESCFVQGFQIRKKNQLPKVRFAPNSGSNTPTMVQLTCPGFPTAEIRYTTDGSPPNAGSTLYSGPFNVAAPATVKAIARIDGANPNGIADSAVNSATYV